MKLPKAIYILLLISLPGTVDAQLSFTNFLEYRYGNMPGPSTGYLHGHYDQFNASYSYNSFTGSLRYEHFLSQIPDASYYRLSKYQLKYRRRGFDIQLGNFDETLGNGLLFRSFDIPGSIFEDQESSMRYGLYRDTRGILAGYSGKNFRVKALRGATLDYFSPPDREDRLRRRDITDAVEAGIEYYGQSAGFIFLRNTLADQQDHFYSFILDGGLLTILRYRFEFAHDLEYGMPVFRKSNASRYGVYSSLAYSFGNFECSWEHKNIHGLLIGSGINLPPVVMKEHTYLLLNRRMHVPVNSSERGSEFEVSYSFNRKTSLLLNYTRLLNELYYTYRYKEYFAEFKGHPLPLLEVKLFADYSEEPFLNENQRFTTGLIWGYNIKQRHNAGIDLQYQLIRPDKSADGEFYNLSMIASFMHSGKFQASFAWEISDDPAYTDKALRHWYSVKFSLFLKRENELSLFIGQRRGAKLYNSGIFYNEFDFEGVELHLKTEF